MTLEDEAYETVASGTAIGEGDDGHSEACAMFDSVAFNCDCRSSHLFVCKAIPSWTCGDLCAYTRGQHMRASVVTVPLHMYMCIGAPGCGGA